jgi:hypothetical protein
MLSRILYSEGGGVWVFFRSEIFVQTIRELEWVFVPEFNIRLHDKNSESDYFFFKMTAVAMETAKMLKN